MGAIALIKNLPKGIVKFGGKIVTKAKVNKPQIYFCGGMILILTGFGWSIYNATKVPDVMKESEAKVDEINAVKEEAAQKNDISEENLNAIITAQNKELRKAQFDTIVKMAKLMGIPVSVFLAGLFLTIGGHRELLRRFGALSSAFASLQAAFDKYRQMNIKEHGEDCDRRYRYGVVDTVTTSAEVTDENGKTKQVKCKVPVVDPEEASSLYSFIFSEEFSRKCPRDPVTSISFLRSQEKFWNTWMDAKQKPVTLYMVLEDLGIELDPDDPRNDYIMIAGWRPNGEGDNKIDFGIWRAVNKPALNMEENVVFLNFNCDGNLYHSTRYTKDGRKIC